MQKGLQKLVYLIRGKARTKNFQGHCWVLSYSNTEILKRDCIVSVLVEFSSGHLNKIPDPFIGLLLKSWTEESVFQHAPHLLLADQPVLVEVVDKEGILDVLVQLAPQHHAQPEHPLLAGHSAVDLLVEESEDAVHHQVLVHGENVHQEAAKIESAHSVVFSVQPAITNISLQGKSPQNGTKRVSVTSAKTFFFPLKVGQKLNQNHQSFM